MGCISPNQAIDGKQRTMIATPSKVGTLQVAIKHIYLRDLSETNFKECDFSLKIWVSNQLFHIPLTDVLATKKNDYILKFDINSFFKKHGRTLNIEVWNIKSPSRDNIAYGLIDLDEAFANSHGSQQYSDILHLNYLHRQGGFANLQLKFSQMPYQQIKFSVQQITTRELGLRKKRCSLKFTVGEEVYETPTKKTNDENQITFDVQTISFKVPLSITEGHLQFIQKNGETDILLGQATIELRPLLSSRRNLSLEEVLQNSFDNTINGSVKLIAISSNSLQNIVESPSPRRKKPRNITSIKVIAAENQNTNESTVKIISGKENVSIENKPFKLQPVPSRAFRGIKLEPIKNEPQSQTIVEKDDKLTKKSSGSSNTAIPIKVGSLPPKNIQNALFQLLAQTQDRKNY